MKRERTEEQPSCSSSSSNPKRWDFKSATYFEEWPSGDDLRPLGGQIGRGPEDLERQEADFGNDKEPIFRESSHHVHRIERFALSRYVTEFTLNANSEEPDETLRNAFDQLINRAIQNAESGGRKVAKLGIWLMGKGLNEPILLPARSPEQNNADVLMAELEKLGQSDADEERDGGMDKRTLLLSEPIQIVVTCLTPPTGAAPRFHPYQNWGYGDRHRIKICNTDDNLCLFYALVVSQKLHELSAAQQPTKQKFRKNPNWSRSLERLLNDRLRLRELAEELLKDAEIPDDLDAYGMEHLEQVQRLWDLTKPGLYRIVLFDDTPEVLPRPIWKGPAGRKYDVALFLSNGHYDVIKKINCFFNLGRKYCVDCECSFDKDVKHTITCKSRCPQCSKVGPLHPCVKEDGIKIHCAQCNRFFFSQSCFEGHRAQTCQLIKRCNKFCQRVYQYDKKLPHKCFTKYCRRCKVYHSNDTGCFIKKVTIPEDKSRYRIVCWDTETRLEELAGEDGQKIHRVNFLSARITCTDCCDSVENEDCEICKISEGNVERMKDWSEAEGHEPVSAFVEWILRAWSRHFKTFLWAHNASRFDGHFVLKYLAETRRRPDVVMNGLKIYEFRVQHSRKHSLLTWRDSCLLMPIALEHLPTTFNLDCDDKPFFPYLYNKKENYNTRSAHLPPIADYSPGSMKKDKFEKFKKWYNDNKNTPFFLPEELRNYCRNDTKILLKAVVEFRRILMSDVANGFDILTISCTIASACMNIFRSMFLQENQLAMVPEGGYERNDRASVLAIKYLDWRAKKDGSKIQHAGNGREKRWKHYKLDGWIEAENKCIEVLGCYWHGCERCFNPDDRLADGKSCRELFEATQDRLLQLREPDDQGCCLEAVEEIWECNINAQLEADAEMRDFFTDLGNERGPIDPRQAYCGGRTGPFKLFAEPAADEKISVFDIVSLYPWVNYSTEYPIGIPEIVHPSPEEICVNWTKPEHLPYKGIYRVRVVPPRGLRLPILPVKLDERLLFGCCHRCASAFRKCNTRREHRCPHSDEQRAYTSNYTHIELERALHYGYRIDRVWRVWNYEEWSDNIFKDYVRLMIKLKIEASGFPTGVVTEEQKKLFADEYRRMYSVELELDRISKNPGLRFIAKLMLNSLWGKFSMRNALGLNVVLTRPQEFFKLVLDHKVEISAIIPLSDEAIRVLYKNKKNFISEHSSSNIVLSLWTTSRARLKLLDYMQQIESTEGAQLLYTDTDSVVVLHKRDKVPILIGEYLGQMSEEYTSFDIRTFVCGGAKQYAFRMINNQTGQEEFVQKIRGITFDVRNSKAMQFEHFKRKVLNYGQNTEEDSPAIFRYQRIQPTKESRIVTREQEKRYMAICRKGIINEQLEVLPFGFE